MVDPTSLPFETVVKIFSQLSTPEIAISSSVCNDWRAKILTDPSINRIIDLSGLYRKWDEEELTEVVYRLCSVSTIPGRGVAKEVKLDVDCFFKQFEVYSDSVKGDFDFAMLMNATSCRFLKLISAISLATKGKLSKVHFEAFEEWSLTGHSGRLGDLFIQTAQLLNSATDSLLEEIHFKVPFPLSVESTGSSIGKNLKKVSIRDNSPPTDEFSYDTGSCRTFLDDLVDCCGTLTKLDIDLYSFEDRQVEHDESEEDELPGLYKEAKRSNETLQELQIKFGPNDSLPEMWDLVTGCSNLSALKLFCFGVTADEELEFPTEVPPFHLKKLELGLWSNAEDDLDWLVDWVGSDLEALELSLQSSLQWSKISSKVLSTIFERSSSLKHLKLADLTLMSFSVPTSTQLLPNLQSLSVSNLSLSGYELILQQSMPRLQHLTFQCSIPTELVDVEKLMNAFSNLLKRCRQSLVSLELRTEVTIGSYEEYEGPKGQKKEMILLSQLQKLDISSSTRHALHLLNNCELRNLKELEIDGTCLNLQFVSKILKSTQLATMNFREVNFDLSNGQLEGEFWQPELRDVTLTSLPIQLLEMLSRIIATNLDTLDLSNRSRSRESLPKKLCSLIGSSASSLVKLSVKDYRREFNDEFKPEEEAVIEFPKLADLKIKGVFSSLGRYLLNNSYLKLQHLRLFLSKTNIAHPQVQNLIRSHAESLESINLHDAQAQEESSLVPKHNKQVLFPKLKSLTFNSRFTSESVEALFFVDGSNLDSLPEEEQFISLKKRLLEIAPKLQTYRRT